MERKTKRAGWGYYSTRTPTKRISNNNEYSLQTHRPSLQVLMETGKAFYDQKVVSGKKKIVAPTKTIMEVSCIGAGSELITSVNRLGL